MTHADFVTEAQSLYPAGGTAITAANWLTFYNGAQRLVARRVPCLTGLVTVSVAITEAGDAQAKLSAWSISGATYANTNSGVLYYGLVWSDPNVVVTVYSDSLGATPVCANASTTPGTLTLAQVASSGITGTVVCAASPASDITYSANTLTFEPKMLATNGDRIVAVREVYWRDASAATRERLWPKTEEWLRGVYGEQWRDTTPGTPEYYYLIRQTGGTYVCPFPALDTYNDQVVVDAWLLPTPATQTADVSELPDATWDAIANEMCRRAAVSDENLILAGVFEGKVQEEIVRIRPDFVFRAETRGMGIGTDSDGPGPGTWTYRITS